MSLFHFQIEFTEFRVALRLQYILSYIHKDSALDSKVFMVAVCVMLNLKWALEF